MLLNYLENFIRKTKQYVIGTNKALEARLYSVEVGRKLKCQSLNYSS